ncbi:MAG TPA: N-acetyl sugar amidotransferase [Desulfocapsa sulfexigens]|nr:N-acetyl sugar amidotransferase [Desulfocapsa sulfexigens]
MEYWMKNENMCNRCILNDQFPSIEFDRNGICNYCHKWDKEWAEFDYNKAEQQLQMIFKDAKLKKRKYDCMVPYSGGRDSSYVLYLCKEKYGMNPLAVTFNNLFMSDYALKNILSTVPKLGVDHVMVSLQPDLLKSFYRAMILKGGEFCSICTCGINYVITVYQQLFNIPLVLSGVSSRVDEQSPFEVTSTHPSYVRKVLLESGFSIEDIDSLLVKRQYELTAIEKIKMKLTDSDFLRINMPDYLSWNNQEIQETLENELHWQTPDKNMDHIDCRFAPIKTFLKNKQIPHFIFKQEKYSQLIRDGQMTREEAINSLDAAIKHEHEPPAELTDFLNFFDITLEDIENKEGHCHLDFITKEDTFVRESMAYKFLAIPWKILRVFRA